MLIIAIYSEKKKKYFKLFYFKSLAKVLLMILYRRFTLQDYYSTQPIAIIQRDRCEAKKK